MKPWGTVANKGQNMRQYEDQKDESKHSSSLSGHKLPVFDFQIIKVSNKIFKKKPLSILALLSYFLLRSFI